MWGKIFHGFLLCLLLVSCSTPGSLAATEPKKPDQVNKIPVFDHVIWVVLENRNFDDVIGNSDMPYLNELATENVLLEQYHAVSHPSLPNYLALIGGSTFDISTDCIDCFLKAPSLPDRIEAAGRTWKTYQEDMPSACYIGNKGGYAQKHNPFIYFDSIRLDAERCKRSVVALSALKNDIAENNLPDFAFISPNLCHSGHDCSLAEVDQWLKQVIEPLKGSPLLAKNSLIAITYDEGKETNSPGSGGTGQQAGGRVAAVLISPLAKPGFKDNTLLSHYGLLKTILVAWQLPDLGATKDSKTAAITAPWK